MPSPTLRTDDVLRTSHARFAWIPYLIALTLAAVAIGSVLHWSTSAADRLSLERQKGIVATVLRQSAATVAHDQEASTVWDESVLQLRKTALDFEWLDNNLGIWLHSYYGHDETYVLDPDNRPIYVMRAGERHRTEDFQIVASTIIPLANELRSRLRSGPAEQLPSNILTPGISDIGMSRGHPVIISVKPVRSDTGEIEQRPGREYFHVSLRRLDGSFIDGVKSAYNFQAARFEAQISEVGATEAAVPFRSRHGHVIGYFVWTPFAPGSVVFARMIWPLIGGFLICAALVAALMSRVLKGTQQLQESRAVAQHLAFHDTLTGLANRALFEDRLEHALDIFRNTAEHRLALIFIDLDRFKRVNDTLGHPAGDELIRQFAARLKSVVRVGDTAARLGGDEFAVIQTEVSSQVETEDLCRRIIEAGAEPFSVGGSQAHVGVSVGVALAGKHGLNPVELSRKADIALYQAKAQGRGTFKIFAPTMDEPIRAREATERDLRAALKSSTQLSVAYQPLYSTLTGGITGVEALVRWDHPANGVVPPSAFIPVAEETGLIEELGEWVLRQACRAGSAWPLVISVNVSPVQLRNPHFANRVLGILADAGMTPDRLEVEITETALLEHIEGVAINLRTLRSFGVRVALDDFGTGYSSFGHLRQFEVDRVKIDRTFVDKIGTGEGGSAIVRAIVDLAHSSGLRTTAEGVETDLQRHFLETIGCNELQGYLMSYPITPEAMSELVGMRGEQKSPALHKAS